MGTPAGGRRISSANIVRRLLGDADDFGGVGIPGATVHRRDQRRDAFKNADAVGDEDVERVGRCRRRLE